MASAHFTIFFDSESTFDKSGLLILLRKSIDRYIDDRNRKSTQSKWLVAETVL